MNAFLEKLRAEPNKRVPLERLQRHFYEVFPEVQVSPDRGARLLEALRALESSGQVALPAKGSWESIGSPPLPKWAAVAPAEDSKPERRDFNSVAWVPDLGWWTGLKSAQLVTLERINEFLLRRRGSFALVPIKERSLEIFGDEKKLDSMFDGNGLFGGRLPLAAIGAFHVPHPLPYRQADAPGRSVLVVENHNSFWSFGEWNHEARRYAAVVYGQGEAFRSTGAALGQVLREVQGTGAIYLGDLDTKGVRMPVAFNAAAKEGEPRVAPALEWYRWIVANGRRRLKPECKEGTHALAESWLGPELADEVNKMWQQGEWMPQESLGFEQLIEFKGAIDGEVPWTSEG